MRAVATDMSAPPRARSLPRRLSPGPTRGRGWASSPSNRLFPLRRRPRPRACWAGAGGRHQRGEWRRSAPGGRRPSLERARRRIAAPRRARTRTGRRPLARPARGRDRPVRGGLGRSPVNLAVQVETGRRVMFGTAGAPSVSVSDAVRASCAIPGVFRPLVLDGRSYVDGGVWSPTNLDRAPAGRGTRVLRLNPTGSMRPSRARPFGAIGMISRSLAAVEALALERLGAKVSIVAPDPGSLAAMGSNLMDAGPRARVIAAGRLQGQHLGRRAPS